MIPPLAPGQINEQHNMVGWKNTFNMRQVTLMNLAASQGNTRNGLKSDFKNYIKNDCMAGTAKSLEILRKNLQTAINKDIECVLRKYLEKFFQPAISNIRNNLGRDSVTDDHIKVVCRQMLEEAKVMYKTYTGSRDSSPFEGSDSELALDNRNVKKNQRKRKESDTDSETNYKRHKFLSTYLVENQLHKLPLKRDGPKWDSDRITQSTLFIMGAKANKALGFGQTRGRLYVRHPELVRYSGDQEDKEWLTSKNLMPPSGGKAYLMILEDIRELAQLDDYKNSPNLQLNELVGFEAPPFLVNKIKNFIEHVRTDKRQHTQLDLFDFHQSHSMTPPIDSAPSTPSDTLQMLESQSVSTSSSKHSENNYIHIPEISPGSNNSLLQSPLPTNCSLLSPNMLMAMASSDNNSSVMVIPENAPNGTTCISSLLANQLSSDNSQDF